MKKPALLFALYLLFIGVLLADETDDSTSYNNQIKRFNDLGKSYYKDGKFSEALLSFHDGLSIAQQHNDSAYVAKLCCNIGVINDMIGNYGDALLYYQKSLIIYDNLNNIKGKESVLNNLGIVYEEMNMPEKALANYFLSLQIKQELGDENSIAGTYNNIAIIYENFLKNTDSAYFYYAKALDFFEEAANEEGVALIKSNMGIIHLRQGQLTKARQFIEESLEIFRRTGNSAEIANVLYFLGKLNEKEGNETEALAYFNKARLLAEEYKMKKLQSRVYFDMAQLYKRQKNFESAFTTFEKYTEVKSKLMDLENIKQIQNVEMTANVHEKEQEIALLKTQDVLKSRELIWTKRLTYVLVLVLVLVLIIGVLNRHKNLLKKKQDMLLLQSQLFRSQTSPHFIFNSLMSIQALLLDNKVSEASDYLVDFAKLIRTILQNTRKSLVPLDQEIETLQHYLSLERLRFGDQFDVDFAVHVDNAEEILFPPMFAQPFIENAINHGLLPAEKKGLLKIDISEVDKTLLFVIEDDGIGREKAGRRKENKEHKSLAIEISRQRSKLIRKRFGKKLDFIITDLKDTTGESLGTRVTMKMVLD